jgi:TRAP-type C4-dicarboxylate transport system permease small subunit
MKTMIAKVLGGVCALLLAFMSCLAVYQVVARYALQNPSTISEDILSYSFVWLSLLAAALVFGEGDHMRISFISGKARGEAGLCLAVLSELLVMSVAVIVLLSGGLGFMRVGAMQLSPTLGIGMDWVYAVLPVSGVLIVAFTILAIIELVQTGGRPEREDEQ